MSAERDAATQAMAAFGLADDPEVARPADVCLLVEGTYPFVSGGVSSWVHDIILGHPDLTFAVLNVGSFPGAYAELRFKLPDNVIALHRVYCQEAAPPPLDGSGRAELREQIRELRETVDARDTPSRVLQGLRRLHVDGPGAGDAAYAEMLADLASNDLTLPELLHGRASFDLLTTIADRVAPDAPFLDLFWHYRAIHVPVLRLLSAPLVRARCYHAVATGYAGLLASVWSRRTGRPLTVTEHGIYAREREMELARADWIRDGGGDEEGGLGGAAATWAPRISPLRRLWSRFFRGLSRLAYARADRIVTLSDVNRRKQLADGAPEAKIDVVPNGVELRPDVQGLPLDDEGVIALPARRLRVGFVGRVVPIKDVVTFVRACDLALRAVPLDVRIIGPMDEDDGYAKRCRDLVATLKRGDDIRFLGPMPPAKIYTDLDVVVLTSFSEGQPLVILEAYACGLPVIATDVGACREMIEGRTAEDKAHGPSGFVTRVATPQQTATALVRLARDARLRRKMGLAGRRRVTAYYQRRDMLASYRALYTRLVTAPDEAGEGQPLAAGASAPNRVGEDGLRSSEPIAGGSEPA
jgi:glycosyltransferase involved in cell wall biosynthesis